eukprot:GHVQ01027408.1.p1 GENE.GHVQ01027408.1~~GHVQ01027408.1.p1  ORF type:complete len:1047 (+),score=237.35 GHVQ01027408.1:966-4106(+)
MVSSLDSSSLLRHCPPPHVALPPHSPPSAASSTSPSSPTASTSPAHTDRQPQYHRCDTSIKESRETGDWEFVCNARRLCYRNENSNQEEQRGEEGVYGGGGDGGAESGSTVTAVVTASGSSNGSTSAVSGGSDRIIASSNVSPSAHATANICANVSGSGSSGSASAVVTASSTQDKDVPPTPTAPRDRWRGRLSFWFAAIGGAVGIGNLWRFPTLCFEYGGGAFFIPYLIALFFIGIPLLTLEFAIGQCFQGGNVIAFNRLSKRFRGVGVAAVFVGFMVTCYYTVILSWGLRYTIAAFHSPYPWAIPVEHMQGCQEQTTEIDCLSYSVDSDNSIVADMEERGEVGRDENQQTEGGPAGSTGGRGGGSGESAGGGLCAWVSAGSGSEGSTGECVGDITGKAQRYFDTDVVGSDKHAFPSLRGYVVLGLCVVWVCIFLALCQGVVSTGIIVYVTMTVPILLLVVLAVRGVMLEGSTEGLMQYMGRWDLSVLWERPEVWSKAAGQIYFSIGVGYGVMTSYASYNKPQQNVAVDTLVVALSNSAVSLLAGVAVFSVCGYLATVTGKYDDTGAVDISQLQTGGPALVFVVYPLALSTIPYSNWICVIFFLTFFLLGVDSGFALAEALVTMLFDSRILDKIKRWIWACGVCLIGVALGLPYTTSVGPYLLDSVDNYLAVIASMFIGLCEATAAGWVYGTRRQLARIGMLPVMMVSVGYFGGCIVGTGIGFGVPYELGLIGLYVGVGWMTVFVCTAILCLPSVDGVSGMKIGWVERLYLLFFYNIELLRYELNQTITGGGGAVTDHSNSHQQKEDNEKIEYNENEEQEAHSQHPLVSGGGGGGPDAASVAPTAGGVVQATAATHGKPSSLATTAAISSPSSHEKDEGIGHIVNTDSSIDRRVCLLCPSSSSSLSSCSMCSMCSSVCCSITILFSITIKFFVPMAMIVLLGQTFSRKSIMDKAIADTDKFPLYIHLVGLTVAGVAVLLCVVGWFMPQVFSPLVPGKTEKDSSHHVKQSSTPFLTQRDQTLSAHRHHTQHSPPTCHTSSTTVLNL